MPEKEYKSCPSHCCARHGCKYGYEECPVETGKVKQEGRCEDCPTLEEISYQRKFWETELNWFIELDKNLSLDKKEK